MPRESEPDWKRLFVAKCLHDNDLTPVISVRDYERAKGREIEMRINWCGVRRGWINEDEPPLFPAVSGVDLGAGS